MEKKVFNLLGLIALFFCITILFSTPKSLAATSGDFEYDYWYYLDGATITKYIGKSGKVNIPSKIDGYTVTALDYDVFSNNSNITDVVIPSTVTQIGSSCFENCKNLTSVTFSSNLKEIPLFCFSGCSSLTEITIPKTITNIDSFAFDNCNNLRKVTICNPNCYIGYTAFGSSKDITIYADANSTAQTFAESNNISFVAQDTHYSTTTNITKATTSEDGKVEVICNYCSQIIKTTILNKIDSVSLSTTSYTYDGQEKKPNITVKDISGKKISASNYSVQYSSGRKNVGTYTVTITFKDNYSGTIQKTFQINAKALTSSNLKLTDMVYTGKKTYPKVTYAGKTLKKDTDYTISKISKNTSIGTASVTLKFKGNYSGTVQKTYKIVPSKVTGISLKSRDTSSITVKWNKVNGAQGYKIYRFNTKTLKYTYYKSTTSTSIKVNRYATDDKMVFIYIKAYKKINTTTYEGTENHYYNCITPETPRYTVGCSNIGKLRINFSNIGYYKNIEVQICINKSFNQDKYDVISYTTAISNYYDVKYVQYYLTSEKNYYVRCREFVYDRNSNIKFGPWGAVKKVYIM